MRIAELNNSKTTIMSIMHHKKRVFPAQVSLQRHFLTASVSGKSNAETDTGASCSPPVTRRTGLVRTGKSRRSDRSTEDSLRAARIAGFHKLKPEQPLHGLKPTTRLSQRKTAKT